MDFNQLREELLKLATANRDNSDDKCKAVAGCLFSLVGAMHGTEADVFSFMSHTAQWSKGFIKRHTAQNN